MVGMNFSWKIAYFVFIAGAFVLLSFVALNYQALNSNVYFVIYLLLVFLVLFGYFVGRMFAHPIKKITKVANELADGNLQSRAYVKSADELGQLARALNRVAQKMEVTHVNYKKQHHLVATKVSTIVRPLHDTIAALEEKAKNRTMEAQHHRELSEKLQIDLVFKEAELIDLKGQLAKVMKRKGRKPVVEES